MARTHARVKGKSGSTKPAVADLSFVTIKKEEVIKLILDMAKEDVSLSKIGMVLRDTHGVPSVKKLVGKLNNESITNQIDSFYTEVSDELTFNVLCVGDFASGKTTFINQFFLEKSILPTSPIVTTAKLTVINMVRLLKLF